MTDTPPQSQEHRLRAGTAARLAGLPVTTLRVWERRYRVVAPAKTESGQRLYTGHDVARLRLLRQLTHAGHAIGTIAALGLDTLQALASGDRGPAGAVSTGANEGVVVGRSVACALESVPGCVLRAVHDDLDAAEAASADVSPVGWLLVRLASLQPDAVDRVLALAARLGAGSTLVLYGFGADASVRALREAGADLRREPLSAHELAEWLRLPGTARSEPAAAAALVEPRRFSDEALARLADLRSPIACECPRHVAEIVAQLAGFERYSQDCTSRGPRDADLHRRLTRTAGAARTLFERALQQVLEDEGLEASG